MKKPELVFTQKDFRKNLISSEGFQYMDLKPTSRKKFLAFMKKHKHKVKISPTGNPGITLTAVK